MSWPTIDQLPALPTDPRFRFEPLAPHHNARDHIAWMTSIEHIRATPGFEPGGPDAWPYEMSLQRNLHDLEMHFAEFAASQAYAFSVVDPAADDVIGCVYVDPVDAEQRHTSADATVRSWVRVDRADLDEAVAETVANWLRESAAFTSVQWPGRTSLNL